MDNQDVPSGYTASDAALVSALDQLLTSVPRSMPTFFEPPAGIDIPLPEIKVKKIEPIAKKVEEVKAKVEVKKEVKKDPKIEPKKPEPKKEEKKEVDKKPEVKEPNKLVPKQEVKQEAAKDDDKPVPVEKLVPKENYRESPQFYEVANFFHVEPGEYEEAKHKLSLIYDWAAFQAQSSRPKDVLAQISELEHKIPPPAIGERRYLNMFRFVKLSQV